jgi:hypothetical protein
MKMRKVILSVVTFVMLLPLMSLTAKAQAFSSGSTGADGSLNCPSNCNVQVPDSGVFNYTTINVAAGSTLQFRANLRNTPVIILAQGAVTIAGAIILSASSAGLSGGNQSPGPGGFYGGSPNQVGFGPGGGQLSSIANAHGKWIGPLSLVPIIGGSGGAGFSGLIGGGGGGGIVIASTTSISATGTIDARGFPGQSSSSCGSGGAVRLVANAVSVSGTIQANTSCSGGNNGVIRFEAPTGSLSFTGTATPAAILSTINPNIVADTNTPTLKFNSIAGYSVPSNPAARPDAVDLLLPSQTADPISVVVQGHNVPVDTPVGLNVSGSNATVTSANLAGTMDASTATLSVSGLSRTAISTMFVFAIFNAPNSLEAVNPKGPDHVAKIRLETNLGSKSKFVFLRLNGTEINVARLRPQFLQEFGL